MATLASSNARSSNARGNRNNSRSNTRSNTRSNGRQQNRNSRNASNSNDLPIAFRVTGGITEYFEGVAKNGRSYVRAKFEGKTTNGKPVKGTVMAFGENQIQNLDINARTKEAGLYVVWDSGVLVPVGPYLNDKELEGRRAA